MTSHALKKPPSKIELRDRQDGVESLARELRIPEFLAHALRCRGIRSANELDLSLGNLEDASGLPDIEKAAQRLARAVKENENIAVAGDFDADGATASVLCVSFLKSLGATRVSWHIPDRVRFGYGLSPGFCREILDLEPNVIVTVDQGVSSVDGVALAAADGVDVIVTDHHLPPDTLPAAYAIVNPAMKESSFRGKLAGVGVAFYLMGVVWRTLQRDGFFAGVSRSSPDIRDWLDLVALGTVADLVPLDRNNRILIRQGLERIRSGRGNVGISALAQAARRPLDTLRAEDLGFVIAPRVNAAGRIASMRAGVECLLSQDRKQARARAARLNELNVKRRSLQDDMLATAGDLVSACDRAADAHCLYHNSFHEGVVGLVAGRAKDALEVPVAVFADSQPLSLGEVKGSLRSVEGVHIRDVLAEIDAEYPNLIQRFGGHAMAAGLTLRKGSLNRFQTILESGVGERLKNARPRGICRSDGDLPAAELTYENARLIEEFGPWGQDFEEPLFHGRFEVVHAAAMGPRRQHTRMTLVKDNRNVEAIAFNSPPPDTPRVTLTYRLRVKRFQGQESAQLLVRDVQPEGTGLIT